MSAEIIRPWRRQRSEALPVRMPDFDCSVPEPTPGSDAALLEADRRQVAFEDWWNGHHYGDPDEDSSEREADAWGDLNEALIDFIAETPALSVAGVLAKLRVAALVTATGVWTQDLFETMREALERLAKP